MPCKSYESSANFAQKNCSLQIFATEIASEIHWELPEILHFKNDLLILLTQYSRVFENSKTTYRTTMLVVLYAPLLSAVRAGAPERESKLLWKNRFWTMAVEIRPNTVLFLKTRKQLFRRQCWLSCMHRYCLPCVLVQREENQDVPWKNGFLTMSVGNRPNTVLFFEKSITTYWTTMLVVLYAPLFPAVRAGSTRRK